MSNLLNSLVNVMTRVLTAPEPEPVFEQLDFKPGSLQDQLMSVSRLENTGSSAGYNELSAGPPPLTNQYDVPSKVVALPKRQGARVIVWSQLSATSHAA